MDTGSKVIVAKEFKKLIVNGPVGNIDGAIKLDDNHWALPHNLETVFELREEHSIDAPAPITTYFDWPKANGRFKLADHQKAIAAFATKYKRSFDLSEVGTRKTHSHIAAAEWLMQEGYIRRVMVVTPLSTLNRVWADSLFFTLPRRSHVVLHGTAAKRRKLLDQDHDWYIINHDGLKVVAEKQFKTKELTVEGQTFKQDILVGAKLPRDDIDLFIIDEGAEFRNATTEKYRILKWLLPDDAWVHWLTGTPRPKAPTDVWAQCKIICPDRVPNYFSAFRDRTMRQVTQFKWAARDNANETVNAAMQPAIRFARQDVIPIDQPVFIERECEMTKEQMKHYKELMRQSTTLVESGQPITAANAGVLRSKLLQVGCGAMYDREGKTHEINAKPRYDLVTELIEQCDEKVIVFVPFTHALEIVHKTLKKADITSAIVHGGVSSTKRDKIFSAFQNEPDGPRVLVADARCMAHGLTLTAASMIIWFGPPQSNNIYVQANGRITRDGQTKTPIIAHIISNSAERKAMQNIIDNGKEQDLLLDIVRGETQNALAFPV